MGKDCARATPSSTLPARQMSASNYLCAPGNVDELLDALVAVYTAMVRAPLFEGEGA
jgi:hypothetical protein